MRWPLSGWRLRLLRAIQDLGGFIERGRHPDPQVQALIERFEARAARLAPRGAAREAARRL